MQREADLLIPWLGKQIEVIVDRPRGTQHPKWPNLIYPIDYGYLPGTIGGDGDPIDVYLLEPYSHDLEGKATVVGIIDRYDDDEFKLVASIIQLHTSVVDIFEAVEFVEQYFDIEVITSSGSRRFTPRGLD